MTTATENALPREIRPTVSPKAVEKVTRFFNASLSDILLELFQNSRRAGATRVDVTTRDGSAPGRTLVIVSDDGAGIEKPDTVLAFGESAWPDPAAANDDPAGMGLYALAGREFTIQSTTGDARDAPWFMKIEPANFDDGRPATVQPAAPFSKPGTVITFEFEGTTPSWIENCLAATARFQRVRVYHNGELVEQHDINRGAFYTERWGPRNAVTFGVHVTDARTGGNEAFGTLEVNGHPVVRERLARVSALRPEDLGRMSFHVTARADDLPELKLVLPSRKEAVENDFLIKSLRPAAEAAIYRGLAAHGARIGVAFSDDNRREALSRHGIELPAPRPRLLPWNTEGWRRKTVEKLLPTAGGPGGSAAPAPGAMIMDRSLIGERMVADTIALLEQRTRTTGGDARLFEEEPRLQSNDWYQRTPRLAGATARLVYDDAPEYCWNLADYPPEDILERATGQRPARILIRLYASMPENGGDSGCEPSGCEPIEYETTWIAVTPRIPTELNPPYRHASTDSSPERAALILSSDHEPDEQLASTLTYAVIPEDEEKLKTEDMMRRWQDAEIERLHSPAEAARMRIASEAAARLAHLVPRRSRATVTIDETGRVNVELSAAPA